MVSASSPSAASFFSDPDTNVGGAVHGVDVLDVKIADDLWIYVGRIASMNPGSGPFPRFHTSSRHLLG